MMIKMPYGEEGLPGLKALPSVFVVCFLSSCVKLHTLLHSVVVCKHPLMANNPGMMWSTDLKIMRSEGAIVYF